ncbi:GPP34 family phosphoprotein [Conexibacter sp. SYSU D00693]|uniref:GOLPH3/VPS74 family protein n=1 Tax=Conexibacter sp. SYSU D00693 TaxID=2812560 RepID=UPI00196A333D|nr:GPP34 family phosphoprotein [Conexibacter sp. SYSU D00693]
MAMATDRLGLHEELLLLVLDDEKGSDSTTYSTADQATAGAILMELAIRDLVRYEDKSLQVLDDASAPEGVLADTLALLRAQDDPKGAKHWVAKLPKELKPLRARAAADLVAHGVLEEDQSKLLGIFSRTRYPTRDPEPERAVRERLRRVLVDGQEPDERDSALVALVYALEREKDVVGREHRKAARKRAKEIAEGDAVGKAVRAAVQQVQGAIIGATIAASASAAVSGGS